METGDSEVDNNLEIQREQETSTEVQSQGNPGSVVQKSQSAVVENEVGTDFENSLNTVVPVAIVASSVIATSFAASNIKTMYHDKQGGSATRTTVRVGTQVGVPTVVGSFAVGAAATTASIAALPVTLAVAGAGVAVGAVCGAVTLGVTLYYNKFYVARKLHNIEESIKSMPKGEISLAHKKALISLIHNSLHLLKGEQGKEKSSTKIKKLDPKILFNLNEIKNILCSNDYAKSSIQSKAEQKYRKKINKDIGELLEHSLLFSLLINDMKHIKEIYACLNAIKENEQGNENQNIQKILAQINVNHHRAKSTTYDALLERFNRELGYTASKKGKLRAAFSTLIPFIPEKKEFVHLHEEVIHLASEINENYQELKSVVHSLEEHGDALKLDTSKQQLFDINAAFNALSYRDSIEENMASLIGINENKSEVDIDYTLDEKRGLAR